MSQLDTGPDSVSSVLKVFGILQALAEQKEIGVTELSQRIMMSKSTVYRFLQTMKTLGYVMQEGDSDKYALSLKLFELGAQALEYQDLLEIADVAMRKLGKATRETVHLASLDEGSIIYLHKIDSEYNLRMYSRIGRRRPIYSTGLGKVLTAWLDEVEVRDMLADTEFERFTEFTLPNLESLMAQLQQVRQQGYAEDNEEMELGLRCFAVPIYDRFGTVIAGLSVSLPLFRFEESQLGGLIKQLHDTAAWISSQMGFHQYPFGGQKA